MAQRIVTLTTYLFRTLLLSLSGIFYILATLAYWWILFNPRQGTPEFSYYTMVIGIFGGMLSFLITLSMAARAYRAVNYPLLARLPSRVEHLAAVLAASTLFSLLLQLLLALLALYRGPNLTTARLVEIPPVWLAVNILAAVLALHASDLVTAGWSRVYLFGGLALFLFGQNLNADAANWIGARAITAGRWFMRHNLIAFSDLLNAIGGWFNANAGNAFDRLFGLPFWPFHAIADAVRSGAFQPAQAMAPAVLLLYATVLFLLAADLFINKDLFLTE